MFVLFHIDYTIYALHVYIKNKQYLIRDIELIIQYRVMLIPSVLTMYFVNKIYAGGTSNNHMLSYK